MRIGVDLVRVKRLENILERHRARFLDRVYTERERAICSGDIRRLAGRFASKEAVSKALGTGIGRSGITFQDIEIESDASGAPSVVLRKAARARFEALGGISISLSISHENDYAIAFCVLETQVTGEPMAEAGRGVCAHE